MDFLGHRRGSGVEQSRCLFSIMDFKIISNQRHVMPPLFFPKTMSVTAHIYKKVLKDILKPWMDKLADRRSYISQEDSTQASTTQVWLFSNIYQHWSPYLCLPSSPKLQFPRLFLLERDREQDRQACPQHSRLSKGCHYWGVRRCREEQGGEDMRLISLLP